MLDAQEKTTVEALRDTFIQFLDTLDASPFDLPVPIILQPPCFRKTLHDSYTIRASYYASQDLALAQLEDRIAVSRQRLRRCEAGLMNALPPVVGLPFEILEEVFRYSSDADHDLNRGDTLATVTQVCSDWRRCAKACPQLPHFSATMDVSRGLIQIGRALNCLQDPITHLTLYDSETEDRVPSETLVSLKYLVLDNLEHPADVFPSLGELANLETLEVKDDFNRDDLLHIDLGNAPNLSHVIVRPYRMPRFYTTGGVKHLTLRGTSVTTVDEFRDDTRTLFRDFNKIVAFHAEELAILKWGEYELGLPKALEELSLTNMDEDTMRSFLGTAAASKKLLDFSISTRHPLDGPLFVGGYNDLVHSPWAMISSLSLKAHCLPESILGGLLPFSSPNRPTPDEPLRFTTVYKNIPPIPLPQLEHLTLEALNPEGSMTPEIIVAIVKERKENGAPLMGLSVTGCLVEPASIPWLRSNVSRLVLRSTLSF